MGKNPHILSERLSAFLRRRVNAKGLAVAIECDPRTAENILAGHWPNARHWLGISAAFGHDVIEAVFSPQTAADRLATEVQALERQLDETRRRAEEAARLTARCEKTAAQPARRVRPAGRKAA